MAFRRRGGPAKVAAAETPHSEPSVEPSHDTDSFIPDILILALICCVSFGIFYNSLEGQFCYDDHFAIKNNKDATGETPLSNLWYNDFWGQGASVSVAFLSSLI